MDKIAIYGANPDTDTVQTFRAVTFDQFQRIPFDLNLAGTGIFSLSPFESEFNADAEIFDMLPVVSFSYLAGPPTGTDDTTIFGRMSYCWAGALENPSSCAMVKELSGEMGTNAPAADTAASKRLTSNDVDSPVIVTGFGFSLTAVAAIATPVLIEVRGDPDGDNVLLWSGRVLCPAGESKEVFHKCNFHQYIAVEITAAAPGATNFVSVTLEGNVSVGGPPL